jgi:hypothetical protein
MLRTTSNATVLALLVFAIILYLSMGHMPTLNFNLPL